MSNAIAERRPSAPAAEGRTVRVRGLVQGVGFRPAVWRLARACGLAGTVHNDAAGVLIRAWGPPAALDRFVFRLRREAPPLARIETLDETPLDAAPPGGGFRIVESRPGAAETGVVPDAATCPECRAETVAPDDRRHRYPFTNCTSCGPRFSILSAIPYDRARTSMAGFALCPACRAEYEDPADRRFHAQPLACPECGPHAWLEPLAAAVLPDLPGDALAVAAALIRRGAIVAVKGIGGFHLACDAANAAAVARLRAKKHRDAKPFALMARDCDSVRRYADLGAEEASLLTSPAAPIVLVPARADGARLAPGVAPGQRTLGFMLPYTPLHHLLLAEIGRPIVLTSGNRSDEPQCTGNEEARDKLGAIADYGLFHDREIVNRVDDSVVRVIGGAARMIRRARGHTPAPLALPEGFAVAPPILALGGELKNTVCLIKDGAAILSQHIGDLTDAAVFADYRRNLALYADLFDFAPQILAIDRHPQYLSSQIGRERAARDGLGLDAVQHHHAHIAACLAENGVPRDAPPVLGIALDGLGYGEDGGLWGGEFLLADYAGFARLGRLRPVPMPGGERAAREPWRNAFAQIDAALGWQACARTYRDLPLVRFLESKPLPALAAMLRRGLNSPPASSCGRLFDAVAAALGICRERADYEGQAAIEMEAIVDPRALAEPAGYRFAIAAPRDGAPATLDPRPLWPALLADLAAGVAAGIVAARFHRGLADGVVALAALLCRREGAGPIDTVALAGGVFQNRVLFERIQDGLRRRGLRVLAPRLVPTNDGGLALGQAAVAAARRLARNPGNDA